MHCHAASTQSIIKQWKQLDGSVRQRSNSILIIDDELHIREMVRQALEHTSYKIIEACSYLIIIK